MNKVKDLTGKRFGKLVALERAGSKNKRALWKCVCDCGNAAEVTSSRLVSGSTRSCGCLKRESASKLAYELGKKARTHGMRCSRIYSVWLNMKDRCNNRNNIHYNRYGGRGISICQQWNDSFESFRDWALANGYSDKLSIERIDFDGNYEPSNCKWIPFIEQAKNRSTTHFIEYKGQKKPLKDWAEEFGINRGTLTSRLLRSGWDVEKALTTPVKHKLSKTTKK